MTKASDVRDLLESGVLLFPGSVDKQRNPVIFVRLELLKFLDNSSATELRAFLSYFVNISRSNVQENGYVFLVDCTKATSPGNFTDFTELLRDFFAAKINKIYVVQRSPDESYVGRAYLRVKNLLSNMQGSVSYPQVTLTGYEDISRVVDLNQVPSYFGGHMDFDERLWVETRAELEKFIANFREHSAIISKQQEKLIRPMPRTLGELSTFQETIAPLRNEVYLPARGVVSQGEALIEEEKAGRNGDKSRFQYCPLSVIHVIHTKNLQEAFDRLSELTDNFLNLWGLQLQKVYLERFYLSQTLLATKLADLLSTLDDTIDITVKSVTTQLSFYGSIQSTLSESDEVLFNGAMESWTCLRDWGFTEKLPADDLQDQVNNLTNQWLKVKQDLQCKIEILDRYNKAQIRIAESVVRFDKVQKSITGITISEKSSDNVNLPIRHHSISDSVQDFCSTISKDFKEIDTSGKVVQGLNLAPINASISTFLDKTSHLLTLNNQCLAIKEQISLFFSSIRDVKDWLVSVGNPFISSHALGTGLEQAKTGKTAFLRFLATSGLDTTKQKITQCSKTMSVILNSHFLDDRSANIIRDTFTQTEVDWKGFGLDVQEHGRDIDLTIEFFEAAERVASYIAEEEKASSHLLNLDSMTPEKAAEFSKLRQTVRQTSQHMDLCHSKFVELSASTNATLKHIRSVKTRVDCDWTKFSEQVRTAEKLIEVSEEGSDQEDRSSVTSFELNDDDNAYRNTKLLIQELVNTEQSYVDDLKSVVEGYKERVEASTECPKTLKINSTTIFGNIEDIYNFHSKIFLAELQRSVETANVGTVFCTNIRNFDMYASYCKNKPHSENFLSNLESPFLTQCQRDLNHVLDLSSYLLKPVQRIMKYHLILEKLIKYSRSPKRKEELSEALKIMAQVPRYANDVIHLMGLEGFTGSWEDLGQLLQQENFLVFVNGGKKPTPRQIFIFENAVLFSKPVPPKKPSQSRKVSMAPTPKYSYKGHYLFSQLKLTRFVNGDANSVLFQLVIYRKEQRNACETFTIQASSTTVRDKWVDRIDSLLISQLTMPKSRAASHVL